MVEVSDKTISNLEYNCLIYKSTIKVELMSKNIVKSMNSLNL